jgi:tetratricopeptide (TPR) repeat protein
MKNPMIKSPVQNQFTARSAKQKDEGGVSRDKLYVSILERGRKLAEEGKYLEAEYQYDKVLKAVPDHPNAHLLMAKLATQFKATRTAVDHMRKALKLGAGHAFIHYYAADAFLTHGLSKEALEHINIALKLKPGAQQSLTLKARILQLAGLHDEAVEIARALLNANQADASAISTFATSQKFRGDEPEIAHIEAIFRDTSSGVTLPGVAYSLGKIFSDFKDYDKAFEYFNIAASSFDSKEVNEVGLGKMQAMREIFTKELITKKAKTGHKSAKPIFIVGMPRSGTTLTEQILASHPDVCGVGELTAMNRISLMLGLNQLGYAKFRDAVKRIEKDNQFIFGENYLNTVYNFDRHSNKYVDKLPHNFLNIGLINIIFPNAKIIHCHRDPIDNCVSCFTSPLNEGHSYAKDLTGLGKYYTEYWSLMNYWKSVSKIPIFDMPYEKTVSDLEGQARALIAHVELPWNDACLKFNEASGQVSTISQWQVRQPIYTTSVKRWKAYENHLGPLIEGLGDLAVTD